MGCAVSRKVLEIILEDKLTENARAMGEKLGQALHKLAGEHMIIGDVRGRGLLWAMELVADRESREPFPADLGAAFLLTQEAYDEGLVIYPRRSINGAKGDHVLVAPPLIITDQEMDELVDKLHKALVRTATALCA